MGSSLRTGSGRGSRAVARYLNTAKLRARVDLDDAAPMYALPTLSSLSPVQSADRSGSPDLLHPTRAVSIDRNAARRALEFAFIAGDSSGLASGALSAAAIAESSFRPESFERELFLDEYIDKCLRFDVEGKPAPLDRRFLKRLLCHPPRDPAVAAFRHEIFAELRNDAELRAALLTVYSRVVRILRLFDESAGHSRYDLPRWRLELLTALRELFQTMKGPFDRARSGLLRIFEFGEEVCDSRGFEELCSLLDFEGDMAQVDLHLCLGADGRVRKLEVRQLAERRTDPFYRGPLARALFRLAMFVRGYRVGEVDLVERWFDHVYAGVLDFLPPVLQLRGDLEFYLTGCHFADFVQLKGLAVCIPDLSPFQGDAESKRVEGLFNPLLLVQPAPPVPCTLDVDSFERRCILTGPNSGGKTRLLQALAFCQLLAQAGFLVPARRARLRRAAGMFVSLGQETSADQKEGRLGTELLRIRQLFELAPPGSLVILDELCSGTNPSEGEEIFHLVIELLGELKPEVFITTHFLQFAAKLAEHADELSLCFLQVELDSQKVPTFQFVPGVATTSLAHQTAARLGVTRDELLALIRRHASRSK